MVDQPASIGALPLTVARDMDCQVAYLPGPTMRRIGRPLWIQSLVPPFRVEGRVDPRVLTDADAGLE